MKAVKEIVLAQNKKYFDEHTGKELPDLMICDIFVIEGMKFAKKYNIKYIVVASMPNHCLTKLFSFPTF